MVGRGVDGDPSSSHNARTVRVLISLLNRYNVANHEPNDKLVQIGACQTRSGRAKNAANAWLMLCK